MWSARTSSCVVFAQTGPRAKKKPSCVWPERPPVVCIFGRIGISHVFFLVTRRTRGEEAGGGGGEENICIFCFSYMVCCILCMFIRFSLFLLYLYLCARESLFLLLYLYFLCVSVVIFVFWEVQFWVGSGPPREPQRHHMDCSVQTGTQRKQANPRLRKERPSPGKETRWTFLSLS